MTGSSDIFSHMDQSDRVLRKLVLSAFFIHISGANLWAEWWAYDQGISGPNYWGLMNPKWTLCNKGHNQSPVNVEARYLLFDPQLSPLEMKGIAISGELVNHGNSLTLEVDLVGRWAHGVNITGGPLSYTYRVCQLSVHFSHSNLNGSEHMVDGRGFAAEFQVLAFNSDLHDNMTSAMESPRGLASISVFVQVSNQIPSRFDRIYKAINETLYKGDRWKMSYLNLHRLLPETEQYVTYEGSLTYPGCYETVTWIIYNRPIYISEVQIAGLRRLRQDTAYNPVLLMAGNIRPLQPLNRRTIRTNIKVDEKACSHR